jgi:arylsulfatase A-like enzyme
LPLAAGCATETEDASDGEVENVVLIVVDSLRPDFVGAYGSPRSQTPNLDSLIAKGLRFNRAFPEALVTVPARRSIFTGQRIFPYRDFEPIYDLGVSPGWTAIDDLDRTLQRALRDAGLRTVQVSDNPHTGFTETYRPFRGSWDVFVPIEGQAGARNPASSVPDELARRRLPTSLRENPRQVGRIKQALANSGYGRDGQQSNSARVFAEAGRQLEDAVRTGERFALVVDCFDPHEPWTAPREYIDLYGDPDYDGPEVGTVSYGSSGALSREELRRAHANYGASVTMTDRWLGGFLDRFDELGLADNTAIVMLADHGVLLGERGWIGKIPSELHPELARVPFAIVHPSGKRAGQASDHFASTHDVAPTLLSLLGLDSPRWMDGHDLSLLLDDEQPPARPYHYGGMFNRYFIRTDQWVLLGDNLGGNRALFDLTLDPGELTNVWQDSAENGGLAEDLYQQVIAATGGRPLPYYDPDVLAAKLAAARERTGFEES